MDFKVIQDCTKDNLTASIVSAEALTTNIVKDMALRLDLQVPQFNHQSIYANANATKELLSIGTQC